MQRLELGRVGGIILVAATLTTTFEASAQSITDARRAEFTPSADHNAVDSTSGAAVVQRYVLEVFLPGGTTPVSTADLGKPAPGTDGLIRLDFVSLLTTPLTPGVVYEAAVSAVGPGGSAAGARSNTFAFSQPCAPVISPSSQSIAALGGTGSSAVTVAAGCPWTAISNAPWITITSGASGAGSGTIAFAVAANTSTTSRTGTLTIAGSTFTVTQAAATCSYAITPTSMTLPAAGGTGSVTVTTSSGCAWTATSGASWVTISSGSSGTGSGTVSFTAQPNPSAGARTVALTIAGRFLQVSQPGVLSCTFSASPMSITSPAAGGTGTITVSTASGCSWTSSSAVSWITVTGSGSGSGSASYSVAPNPGTSSRSGTLTVGGVAINVEQAAPAAGPRPPLNLRIVR